MDEDVVDLASRRPTAANDVALCRCGSGWWTIRGPADVPGLENGALSVTPDGRVTGYTGELRCLECGEPGPSAANAELTF